MLPRRSLPEEDRIFTAKAALPCCCAAWRYRSILLPHVPAPTVDLRILVLVHHYLYLPITRALSYHYPSVLRYYATHVVLHQTSPLLPACVLWMGVSLLIIHCPFPHYFCPAVHSLPCLLPFKPPCLPLPSPFPYAQFSLPATLKSIPLPCWATHTQLTQPSLPAPCIPSHPSLCTVSTLPWPSPYLPFSGDGK